MDIKIYPYLLEHHFYLKHEYNRSKVSREIYKFKNKCIIIGGGLGFIPTLAFHKSKNKILVFEINKTIINNLEKLKNKQM